MQDEPRNTSFATPVRRDASITLLAIARLSYRKSPGRMSLAWMPPTRAAASSTASGRCRSNQRSTGAWSRRSTSSRPTVSSPHSSSASRRINAEPTMPRWPAMNTRRPLSGKSVGDFMPSIASRDGNAARRVGKSGLVYGLLAPRKVDVVPDHHLDQLCEGNPRLPAQNAARLSRIAAQRIDLGRPEVAAIDLDMAPPFESSRLERELDENAHAVRLAGGDDVVVWLLLLQHQPHGLDIVTRKAPIALRFEVSQVELVLKTLTDAAYRPGHLTRDESLAATRALMVE